mgnify:CR=1 FL=1
MTEKKSKRVITVRDILYENELRMIEHLNELKSCARNATQAFYFQRSIDRIIDRAKQRYLKEKEKKELI